MALKAKRPGQKKPHAELKSGASHSQKLGKLVEHERLIDRARDRYLERVTDYETGQVIHHTDEPLSQHHGHGSAKKRSMMANYKLERSGEHRGPRLTAARPLSAGRSKGR